MRVRVLVATELCDKQIRGCFPRMLDPERTREDVKPATEMQTARHALYCCQRIPEIVNTGDREKAMRWLGFVQGIMWTLGMATVAELKQFNTADPNPTRP